MGCFQLASWVGIAQGSPPPLACSSFEQDLELMPDDQPDQLGDDLWPSSKHGPAAPRGQRTVDSHPSGRIPVSADGTENMPAAGQVLIRLAAGVLEECQYRHSSSKPSWGLRFGRGDCHLRLTEPEELQGHVSWKTGGRQQRSGWSSGISWCMRGEKRSSWKTACPRRFLLGCDGVWYCARASRSDESGPKKAARSPPTTPSKQSSRLHTISTSSLL